MIVVMRLGHRPDRDQRVTTHVALTARALGADEVWVSTKDPSLERSVRGVVERFGGGFVIKTGVEWRKAIRSWEGTVVHLTMYGESLSEALPTIPDDDLMVVVGAEKVPREVYEMAHRNVSVGNQPHSEVAALAIFLDRLKGGKAVERDMKGRMRIVPNPRGKTVVDGREGKAREGAKR
ncbi:MAG: tRNA (cytidine(56)-2'-O)-methyltransferase [Candidatus Thermoplasmatota archaeon]